METALRVAVSKPLTARPNDLVALGSRPEEKPPAVMDHRGQALPGARWEIARGIRPAGMTQDWRQEVPARMPIEADGPFQIEKLERVVIEEQISQLS